MNETQLEQIIQSYGADILRFCRITAGSREEGDELYQDAMLILLEKLDRLDMEQNIKSYVISIALKLWQNRRRKWMRRLRLVPVDSLEALEEQGIQPGGPGESPEDALIRRQQVHMVRQAVEQLPEKYRLPIQMYYSADLSISAIARILELPENTVKSRLHRAKDQIRRKLEEMEYEGTAI